MQEIFPQNEDAIANDLGFRLQEAVKRGGGPQVVANATGIGMSSIYNYQKLRPWPPIDWVYRLCQHSGVRPEYLFMGELPVSADDDTGDWETPLPRAGAGERRVGVLDVTASAGYGEQVLSEEPRHWFTMPLDWLMLLGDPDSMVIIKVDGDSMEPELRSGDHAMIDRSQRQAKDGLCLISVDDHLFLKRLRMTGRNKGDLVSSNPAYPAIPVEIFDEHDEISQVGAHILGRVVWAGRTFR